MSFNDDRVTVLVLPEPAFPCNETTNLSALLKDPVGWSALLADDKSRYFAQTTPSTVWLVCLIFEPIPTLMMLPIDVLLHFEGRQKYTPYTAQ